jgi:hypothetical protein
MCETLQSAFILQITTRILRQSTFHPEACFKKPIKMRNYYHISPEWTISVLRDTKNDCNGHDCSRALIPHGCLGFLKHRRSRPTIQTLSRVVCVMRVASNTSLYISLKINRIIICNMVTVHGKEGIGKCSYRNFGVRWHDTSFARRARQLYVSFPCKAVHEVKTVSESGVMPPHSKISMMLRVIKRPVNGYTECILKQKPFVTVHACFS